MKDIRAEFPEYAAIHSHVLQDVLARLDKTYQAFFRRVKAGEKAGFPRFQARTATTPSPTKSLATGPRWTMASWSLSKIGRIAVRWSRPMEGTPKTVTISKEADGWYVCFSCADVPVQPLPATGQETGIDLGIEAFATLSDGTRIFTSWLVSQSRARAQNGAAPGLAAQERQQSPAQGGHAAGEGASEGAAPAAGLSPQDGARLVRANDVIYHEDLQTANMVKNHHLAKSIHDAGWSAFLSILSFKAACAGRSVVAVPPAYTSQICSGCGVLVAKGLSVRWHSCPDCGTSLHRDHNAAKNIERLGQSLRGGVGVPASENRESVGL